MRQTTDPGATHPPPTPALTSTHQAPFALVRKLGTAPHSADRAEQVVHQLETAIAVGLISYGERLPPERELAAQLGVAVLTLRAALASLRERGLIHTQRGRGGGSVVRDAAVVTDNARRQRLRELSTQELRDLGDLSGSITAAAARLAAARADDSDHRRLRALADSFRTAPGTQERRCADSRFHLGLAVAAQSNRLAAGIVEVQGEITPLLWASRPDDQLLAPDVAQDDHHRIIDAIAVGDEATAHTTALEHSVHETEALINAHLQLVLAEGP